MRHALLLVVAATASVLMTWSAAAQPPTAPPSPPRAEHAAKPLMDELKRMSEADIRSLVEMVRMVRLTQELGLTDEQAVVLVRQFSEVKEETGRIQRERQELGKALRELVNASAPEDQIQKKLDELVARDKESLMKRFDAFERASAGLTPAQRTKLYLFMGDFDKRMRTLIEKAREQFREQRGERMGEPVMREDGPFRRGGPAGPTPRERFGGGRGAAEGRPGARRGVEGQPLQQAPAPEPPEQE